MFTVSITNQKGGVGKTTTSYHLARAAHLRGLRTLVIDLDPQGNASDSLSKVCIDATDAGMADVLSSASPVTLDEVIASSHWSSDPGPVWLAPSGGDALAMVRNELVTAGPGREMRLREALAPLASSIDLVLIDCAPSLDALTTNAFSASDAVVVVTQSRLYSASGLAHLLETLDAVRAYYNPGITVAGVIVNQHRRRTLQGTHWLERLTQACEERGLPLLDPPVPDAVAISDAAESGKGLDEWPGGRNLAALYDALLAPVLAAGGEVL